MYAVESRYSQAVSEAVFAGDGGVAGEAGSPKRAGVFLKEFQPSRRRVGFVKILSSVDYWWMWKITSFSA